MRAPLLRAAMAAHLCLFLACSAQLDGPESGGDVAQGEPVRGGSTAQALTPDQAALARWTPVINLPLVPVSAANLPDGKVLLWSAEDRFGFGQQIGRTYTTTFDPATSAASERLVSETGHNMFCPGTANLPDGRILVNGGLTSPETSIFDPSTGTWTAAGDMNIPRAYQGTTPLQDGSVFTLGGSWAGGVGNIEAMVFIGRGEQPFGLR